MGGKRASRVLHREGPTLSFGETEFDQAREEVVQEVQVAAPADQTAFALTTKEFVQRESARAAATSPGPCWPAIQSTRRHHKLQRGAASPAFGWRAAASCELIRGGGNTSRGLTTVFRSPSLFQTTCQRLFRNSSNHLAHFRVSKRLTHRSRELRHRTG